MIKNFMFTSESVTEGHPDKLCDQISDSIVDYLMMQDPYAKVRAECAVSAAILFIAARFQSDAQIDFTHLARKTIKRVGYTQPDFNPQSCSILCTPQALPPDQSVRFDETALSEKEINEITVKNQATVFGFACSQTPEFMPYPIWLAHKLAKRLTEVRKQKVLPYVRPDGRVQVGVEYIDRIPKRIHSLIIHVHRQAPDKPGTKKLIDDIRETVLEPICRTSAICPDAKTKILINPEGPYLGGPTNHSGLTGRKSAIDTYGEYTRHSGKALSGKDPSRIDRIGAYAARYAAKNIVAAGLADECEIMISYSPGLSMPVSLVAQSMGTSSLPDERLTDIVKKHFDFRFAALLQKFRLRHLPATHPNGFYQMLAAYGHFGRTDMDLPWEKTDMVDILKDEIKC
ncbi:MAG: methionine adenosyltransferase [Pseudomonadota bacterium]